MDSITKEMYETVRDFRTELISTQKEIDRLADNIGKNLQQAEADLEQGLILGTETPESVAEKLDSIETKLLSSISQKQDFIEAKLDKLLGDIERIDKKSLGQIIMDDLKDKWEGFKNFSSQAVSSVKNVFSVMKDAVRNGVTRIAEPVRDFFHYGKAVALDKMETLNRFADRKMAELDADIAFTIKQPLAKAGEKVKAGLGETISAMRDAVSDAKTAVVTTVRKANKAINDGKMSLCSKLEDKLSEKMETYSEKREALAEKLKEAERSEKE